MLLEVDGVTYCWPLPEGQEQLTVAGLKDHIQERTQRKVLYHQKLRFSARSGEPIADEDPVPLEPAVVRVGGPGSVVQMLALWCSGNERRRPEPQAPGGSASRPGLERPRRPARPAPQLTPGAVPQRAPTAVAFPEARKPRAPAASATSSGYSVHDRRQPRPSGLPMGISPPPGLAGPRADGAEEVASAVQHWAASAARQAQLEEERELQAAVRLSQLQSEADEEAQMRWAMEESARLAKQQEEVGAPSLGGQEAADHCDAVEGEAGESSDEEPPPLELIPNSEE